MKNKILIVASCILGVIIAILIGIVASDSRPIGKDIRARRFYESEAELLYRLDRDCNKHVIIENKKGDLDKFIAITEEAIEKYEDYYNLQLGYITKAESNEEIDREELDKLKEEIQEVLTKCSDSRKKLISWNQNLDQYFGSIQDSYANLVNSIDDLAHLNLYKYTNGGLKRAKFNHEKSKIKIDSIDSYKGKVKEKLFSK